MPKERNAENYQSEQAEFTAVMDPPTREEAYEHSVFLKPEESYFREKMMEALNSPDPESDTGHYGDALSGALRQRRLEIRQQEAKDFANTCRAGTQDEVLVQDYLTDRNGAGRLDTEAGRELRHRLEKNYEDTTEHLGLAMDLDIVREASMVSVKELVNGSEQHHAEKALREFCVGKMLEKHPGIPLQHGEGDTGESGAVNHMASVELERLKEAAMAGRGRDQAVTAAAERVNEINRDIAEFNETGEIPGWARAMTGYDPESAAGNWICPERMDPSASPEQNAEFVRNRWADTYLRRDDMTPQEFAEGMMSRHYDPALSGKTQLYQGVSYQDDAPMNFEESVAERYPNSLAEGLEGNAQTAYGKAIRNTLMYGDIVMNSEIAARSEEHGMAPLSASLTRGIRRMERMGEALHEAVDQLGERENTPDYGALAFDADPKESWTRIMEMTNGFRTPEALIGEYEKVEDKLRDLNRELELKVDTEDHDHPSLIMSKMASGEMYHAGDALRQVLIEDENAGKYRESREKTGESSLKDLLNRNPGLDESGREALEWYWRDDFVNQPGDPFRERDLAGDARKLQAELEEAGLSEAGATGYSTKAVLIDNAVKRMQQATFLMEAAKIASEERG